MSLVKLTIQLRLEQSSLDAFDGADLMVIPHIPAEREGFLRAMARTDRLVEASGDAEAIQAFQWLGGLLSRAAFTKGSRLKQQARGRRDDA